MGFNTEYFSGENFNLGDGWHIARLWLRQNPERPSDWYITHGEHDCYQTHCSCGAKIPERTKGIINMLNGFNKEVTW